MKKRIQYTVAFAGLMLLCGACTSRKLTTRQVRIRSAALLVEKLKEGDAEGARDLMVSNPELPQRTLEQIHQDCRLLQTITRRHPLPSSKKYLYYTLENITKNSIVEIPIFNGHDTILHLFLASIKVEFAPKSFYPEAQIITYKFIPQYDLNKLTPAGPPPIPYP